MHRHPPSRPQSMIFAILALLFSGCVPINTPPAAVTDIALPTSSPTAQATLATPSGSEPTLVTTAPTGFTLPANATCSQAEIDQYEKDVIPLTDEHAVDSEEAKKMEELSDETQILALKNQAMGRLESLRSFQAPPCLREAHEKLILSFDLLVSTWNSIQAADYPAATTHLKNSYEALGEGLGKFTIIKLGW